MRRKIYCTEDENISKEDLLQDRIKKIQDNFSYAVDGLDKLIADGRADDAEIIASQLEEGVELAVDAIAQTLVEGGVEE